MNDDVKTNISDGLAYGLFWSWNAIFLAFMAFGFAPTLLPETFTAVRTGSIPSSFLLYGLVLTLIPVIAVLLGLTLLRGAPRRLFALGYVVEGPLMLLLVVRLFLIRQATLAVTMLLLVALLGMGAFLWDILHPNGRRLGWLRLMGLTLMGAVSLYAAAWIAFYALPASAELLRMLGDVFADLPRFLSTFGRGLWEMVTERPFMILFSVFGFILMIYTASLFILAPIAVPFLSLRSWWRTWIRQKTQIGVLPAAALVLAVLAGCAGLFAWSNRQPQQHAFDLLENPPKSTAEAAQLIAQSDTIRLGLLNSYLAPFRYLSAKGEVRHIREIYEYSLKLPQQQALAVQNLYEGLAQPMLYDPVHRQLDEISSNTTALVEEPRQAARMYRRFFDTPITEGERETIVNAVRTTWQADQAEAAWQAVDDREVRLVRQELQIDPQGDWADLQLHEVYQNQTAELEEVIYYFNLPESAVITGLWLGSTPDKTQAFSYQIAPRGAAQAVYREQTRVMKDPALVEQIGPRQYRLRAYPVPPLQMNYDQTRGRTLVEEAPELHLWITWRELASSKGTWPLPHLAELRNVYWDQDTVRLVGDQEMTVASAAWLPDELASPQPAVPAPHRVDLPGGRTVLALPVDSSTLPSLPDTLSLALVLDRSRSMETSASQLTAAIDRLNMLRSPTVSMDVFLTASPYRGEDPSVIPLDELKVDEILYFGGQNAAQLLTQFDQLKQDRRYDAVIVITDGSGYELGEPDLDVPIPDFPVWLVHLNENFSLGYDDSTLDAIQASGGGITGDIDTVFQRLALRLAAAQPGSAPTGTQLDLSGTFPDWLDGRLWLVVPTDQVGSFVASLGDLQIHPAADAFTALAARRLILAEMQENRGNITQLDTLDALHALAIEYGIVTPYSSMIVLVDDRQKQLLEQLSELKDRYQREVEAVGATAPASPVPLTGVPEPHEWVLLALVAGMLAYLAYTKYGGKLGLAFKISRPM